MFTEKDQARLDDLLAKEKEVGRGKDPALTKQIKALLKKKKGNKGKGGSGENKDPKFKPGNDFSWWNKEPELLKDAANIKSNWIPGTPFDDIVANFTVSGVEKIHVLNVYGADRISTNNVNLWARNLYLKMFQKYRGISAYEATDLGLVIMAGIEVFMLVAKLERIYGVLNRYSKSNVNLPRVELEALGLTLTQADYIRDHLSDFRFDLNILIKKMQRICIPSDMTILANKLSLFGYEYIDHDNVKGQVIIFDYDNYGIFNETDLTTGSAIKTGTAATLGYDVIDFTPGVDNMFPLLEAMIDALVGSSSVQKIYGDLVTWFGDEQMLTFLPLTEDYVVVPSYSESILHKLHNMMQISINSERIPVVDSRLASADQTTLQTAAGNSIGYFYQVDNCIVTMQAVKHPSTAISSWQLVAGRGFAIPVTSSFFTSILLKESLLDTYRVTMDEETVTEGCLFKYKAETFDFLVSGVNYHGAVLLSDAFELIIQVALYKLDFANDTVSVSNQSLVNTAQTLASQSAGYLALIDWAPLSYYQSMSYTLLDVFGDIDECVLMNKTALAKIQRSAVLSGLRTDIHVIDKANH